MQGIDIRLKFNRFIYGIIYGLTLPLSTTLYSEISSMNARGKGIIFINFCVGIGKLYAILLGYIILDGINKGKIILINKRKLETYDNC